MSRRRKTSALAETEHLAWLARIELTKREKAMFARQISEVIAYFEKIDEVDTRGVDPTYHILDLANVSRNDEAKATPVEPILRNVPEKKDGFVKAPRMG